jgi:hypothetical protein
MLCGPFGDSAGGLRRQLSAGARAPHLPPISAPHLPPISAPHLPPICSSPSSELACRRPDEHRGIGRDARRARESSNDYARNRPRPTSCPRAVARWREESTETVVVPASRRTMARGIDRDGRRAASRRTMARGIDRDGRRAREPSHDGAIRASRMACDSHVPVDRCPTRRPLGWAQHGAPARSSINIRGGTTTYCGITHRRNHRSTRARASISCAFCGAVAGVCRASGSRWFISGGPG